MTAGELCTRNVINMTTGKNLGKVDDLAFDPPAAAVNGIILYGRLKWFGLLGREKDTVIPWEKIEKIGHDVVLVRLSEEPPSRGFQRLLRNFRMEK